MAEKEVYLGRAGADPQHGRPGRGARRAVAAPDLPDRGGRRAARAGLRGRAPRPGDRLRGAGGPAGDGRGDVLADAPVVLAGPARAAQPAGRAGRGVGAGGPGVVHRRRRLPPGALLADGHRARPHRLERRHDPSRRGADRRPDARPADPRDRRPVGAALRPARRVRGVVRADLRAPPGGGLRRAGPADEQGPLAGPPLHRRARAGAAAVAGPAGLAGAGDRRRDDLGLHRAGHPGAVVVAAGGVRADRAGRAAPGPAAAGAVQAEGRDRAPGGAVRAGAGVHPGRAAGRLGVPAPRVGRVGGGRRCRPRPRRSATGAASCSARRARRRGGRWPGTRGWPRRSATAPA